MMSLPRVRFVWITALSALLIVMLAGCVPDATSEIISPELGPKLVAAARSSEVVAVVEAVVELPSIIEMSDEEINAGLDPDFVAALADADPTNGETLALVNGCIGCHALDPAAQMTGPTWFHVGDTAVGRIEGLGPAAYLYDSIVAPNDYIVADYPSAVMPQNYSETISNDDLADLVAYLLEQHEDPTE